MQAAGSVVGCLGVLGLGLGFRVGGYSLDLEAATVLLRGLQGLHASAS